MKCRCLAVAAALAVGVGFAHGQASFKVSAVGGAVLLSDHQTLVVSLTADATLLYLDTVADKELKRVEVEFKPAALAVQNDKLFAAAKGASAVHVLDAASGKELKTVKAPGDPLLALACHPTKGLLYATNGGNEVLAIDPEQGTANKTRAKGQMIAVAADDDKFVYTGVQKPIRDEVVMEKGPGGRVTVSFDKANLRAVMLKYEVDDQDLKLNAYNDNAAINGRSMNVSPDGKLIAMAGGGGWRPKNEAHYNYSIAVFDASDMQTQMGQVETGAYPAGIAFHPVLPLGAAFQDVANELSLFSSKSFAKKESFKVQKGGVPVYLGFAGNGTKVVYVSGGGGPGGGDGMIQFFPIPLTDKDQEALKQAFVK